MSSSPREPEATLSAVAGLELIVARIKQRWLGVSPDTWMVVLAGLLALASFGFGERIAIRDGLGWEGEMYASWVKDLHHEVFEAGIDAYCIQRILPSAILHYSFRLLQIQPTVPNILRGFAALNVISIMLVAYFWCLTANHLRISNRGKWLGFIGLFLNFAVLKCSGYYVVMTDMPAFASGAAMAYCYITRRRVGLWAATIVGSMLWPTQLYIGTVLSLFPKGDEQRGVDSSSIPIDAAGQRRKTPWHLHIVLAGLAALYWTLWSSYACSRIQIPLWGVLYPVHSVLALSFVIAAAWVFLALKPLLDDGRLYRLPGRVNWQWVGGAMITLLVAAGVKGGLQALSTRPGYMGLPVYAFTIGISAVAKPGLFIVAHLVYYGPLWMLAAYFWPSICREIQRERGLGLLLAIAIGACHALDAESRHLIYLLPLLMPFFMRVIDRQIAWTPWSMATMSGVSILTSKCWLMIGGPFTDNATQFPDQFYWMNVGAFMADRTYAWQLIGCVVCAIGIYHALLRSRPQFAWQTEASADLTVYPQPEANSAQRQIKPPNVANRPPSLPIFGRLFAAVVKPASEAGGSMLPALTGVRAMAAYLVFLHHYAPKSIATAGYGWRLLSEAHIGVTMFFVLSGFLIAYRYEGKLRLNAAHLKQYFWNRFARIYPLYFLLLIPTLILAHEHRFGRWFIEMTLLKGFFDEYKFAGIGQAWSLTVEETFYFGAPLLLIALRSRYRAYVLPTCYAIGVVLLVLGLNLNYHRLFGTPQFICSYTFFGRSFEFLLGAWLAMNLQRLQVFKTVPNKTYLGLAGMLAGLIVLDGLKGPVYLWGVLSPGGMLVNNLFMPFAIGMFYLGLLQDESWLKRLFSTPALQLLGKSSYAFYLIHLGFIADVLVTRVSGIWLLLSLIAIAIVLFKFVEEPLNHFLRDRGPGRSKSRSQANASEVEMESAAGRLAA